ncbi:MAG TPA: cupin domain-containing protein [Burkholderiales bacterium]|jgi:mannose-6-phosphate isomerase-like protein (cupin superfamily)|nr:cupin domain-containing protein [Burkholderiales bacterium]
MKPLDLASTFVVLQPDQSAAPVPVTPTIWQELDRDFEGFSGRVLVSCFSFDSDWDTWEMHPAGDEIVCLLSGRASFEFEGRGHVAELSVPGSYVIVPKGTWHTAHTSVPTKMLFITPGEGTQNKAVA